MTVGFSPCLEERQKGNGGKVHGGDISVEDAVPTLKVLVVP